MLRNLILPSSMLALKLRAYSSMVHNAPVIMEQHSLSSPVLPRAYPYIWLRDSCICPQCIRPATGSKIHRTSDFSPAIQPVRAAIEENGLRVDWKDHSSFFPFQFLLQQSSTTSVASFHRCLKCRPWSPAAIKGSANLFVPFQALKSGELQSLIGALTQLIQYGLVFVTGVPVLDTSNEGCATRELVSMLGILRTTMYGELFDVRDAKSASRNIAYTNKTLDLHQDLLYLQHPPRYQMLHCLRNRNIRGGQSVFVDALKSAEDVRIDAPAHFEVLATTPVAFHHMHDGHHMYERHPTLELSRFPYNDSDMVESEVRFINYSPPFQAPLAVDTPRRFYQALADFATRLSAVESQFFYLLREGDVAIFDNRRVLHARTAFEEVSNGAEEPNRWLKGCYLEADDVLDRLRMHQARLEKEGKPIS